METQEIRSSAPQLSDLTPAVPVTEERPTLYVVGPTDGTTVMEAVLTGGVEVEAPRKKASKKREQGPGRKATKALLAEKAETAEAVTADPAVKRLSEAIDAEVGGPTPQEQRFEAFLAGPNVHTATEEVRCVGDGLTRKVGSVTAKTPIAKEDRRVFVEYCFSRFEREGVNIGIVGVRLQDVDAFQYFIQLLEGSSFDRVSLAKWLRDYEIKARRMPYPKDIDVLRESGTVTADGDCWDADFDRGILFSGVEWTEVSSLEPRDIREYLYTVLRDYPKAIKGKATEPPKHHRY